MKKFLSILLCAALIAAIAVPASAAGTAAVGKSAHWYDASMAWAAKTGLSDLAAAKPTAALTRTDLVSALYAYAKHIGLDVSGGEDTNILSYDDAFDIHEGKYEAFQWSCFAGLTGKEGETKLYPNAKVTREDMISMLCEFDALCGRDVTPGGMAYREFADWSSVSKSANSPMMWAISAGLVNGTASAKLSPKSTADEAQLATVLMRYETYCAANPVVTGVITDATMATITIRANGKTYSFDKSGASVNAGTKGLLIGETVTIAYTGTLGKDAAASRITVK
jgi:hypothetical protein